MQGTSLKRRGKACLHNSACAFLQILVIALAVPEAAAQIGPIALNDTYSIAEDSGDHDVDVLANDIGFDSPLTITAVTAPSGGTATIAPTGTHVVYRPADDFAGSDAFAYTIENSGGSTATATVAITIAGVNDAPAAANDALAVDEDTAENALDVLANDTDVDGDALEIEAVTAPSEGGTVVVAPNDRSLLYSPPADFNGDETFSYTVTDGAGETATAGVTVTVTPVNDAPVATADAFTVAEDSGSTALDVLANDTDPDGPAGELRITAVTAPASGSVVVDDEGRRVEYMPAAEFAGTDTFTYTVADDVASTAVATVTITVDARNDDPAASDDSFTVDENSAGNAFDLLGNDGDPEGGALTITDVTTPDQGGTAAIASDGGSVVYTPAADFDGEERFSYVVEDADGGSDSAAVVVTVANVNAAPVASDDGFSVTEDGGANSLDVLANDSDADDGDPLMIMSVTNASGGAVTIAGGGTRLEYVPAANFAGSDSFTYTVADSSGATDAAAVTVTVTAVNDAPVAANDSFVVAEDSGSNRLDVLANDDDPDGDALHVTVVAAASQGGAAAIENGGGAVLYTPAAEFGGSETFAYTVTDAEGVTATATVTVSVTASNDAPVVAPDPIPDQTAQELELASIDLAQFVSDADDPAATLVYALAPGSSPLPPGLALAGNGLLSGTPQLGSSVGEHTLAFTVSDGKSTTTSVPFRLTVLRAGRIDLSVDVGAAPNPARPNETVTWTFTIANAAPDTPATSVRLDVRVAGDVPFAFDDASSQGCTVTPTSTETLLACTVTAPVPGAGNATVQLTGRGIQPGDLTATATVSIDAPSPIDDIEDNDSASATLSIAQIVSSDAAQRIDGVDARAAAAGDLDGDGHADLVVATGPAQAVLVFFNVVDPANEHKRLLSTAPLALGQAGTDNDVALADVDADGDLDVVTAAGGGRPNMVFANDGAGGFSGTALPNAPGALSVAAGDADGDGHVDLVFGRAGADAFHRGTGSSTAFLAAVDFGGGESHEVLAANLLGNDVLEVVVANADGDAAIYGGTGGTLALDRTLPTGPTTSVASGDFNGDGFTDLVFGKAPTGGSPDAANVVFLNTAASGGGFFLSEALGASPTIAVASADADIDGDLDLVFVNRTGAHKVFINFDAAGEFVLHPQQVAEPNGLAVVAASLGSDDRLDLAIAGADGIGIYYNDGDGNFGLGDTEAPTLRLNGVPDVTLTVGAAYSDAGATATDPQDGDVSDSIVVTNPVDTAVIGTYEVVYEAADRSGNRAAPLRRTVRVATTEGEVDGGGGGGAADALLALLLALGIVVRAALGTAARAPREPARAALGRARGGAYDACATPCSRSMSARRNTLLKRS